MLLRKLSILILCLLLHAVPVQAGSEFPDLPLTGAPGAAGKAYLGLPGDAVRPSAVGARYLFVEVFSMYCPICQRDAPAVNRLYEKVRDSALGGDVRFIGIGAGNSAFEVDVYRKKFAVEFPLFDDPEFIWHKALGEVGTPAFYLVDLRGGMTVLYHHVGPMSGVDTMQALIGDLTAR